MGRLSGSITVVTGAAQGMRETHARLFGEDEALAVLADANSSDGERIAAELGPNAHFIAHDVSDGSSWNGVVRGAEEAFGKGRGSFVDISSITGMLGTTASSNAAYRASKWAVRGMAKLIAAQHGGDGIRVNSVHPDYIHPPMMVAPTDADSGGAAGATPLGEWRDRKKSPRWSCSLPLTTRPCLGRGACSRRSNDRRQRSRR